MAKITLDHITLRRRSRKINDIEESRTRHTSLTKTGKNKETFNRSHHSVDAYASLRTGLPYFFEQKKSGGKLLCDRIKKPKD